MKPSSRKFLVWDTSSKVGCLAAFEALDKLHLVGEWMMNVEAGQSEKLLWGIHQLLQSCRWTLQDVDCFGIGCGPGSFTGLRIGVTTARTLGQSLGKPVVAVSSLAVLARPVAHWAKAIDPKTWVIAAIDASKGDWFVYQGLASRVLNLGARGASVAEVISPEDFLSHFLKKRGRRTPWVAVGQVLERNPEIWKRFPKTSRLFYPFSHSELIQGRYLAELVWESYCRKGSVDALSVFPAYLRASSAELQWKG